MRPSDMSASQRPTLLLTLLLTLTLPVWADPATRALRERESWNDLNQQSRANTQAVENQMRSQSLQLIEQAHQQRMAALDANFIAKLQQAIDGYYAQQDAERQATDAAQAEQRRLASRTALQRPDRRGRRWQHRVDASARRWV